jgi:hypothetical protein
MILSFCILKYSLLLNSSIIFLWFFYSSTLNSSSSFRNSLLIFSSLNLDIYSITLSLFSALLISLLALLRSVSPAVCEPNLPDASIDSYSPRRLRARTFTRGSMAIWSASAFKTFLVFRKREGFEAIFCWMATWRRISERVGLPPPCFCNSCKEAMLSLIRC